jgi:hypothetical protein
MRRRKLSLVIVLPILAIAALVCAGAIVLRTKANAPVAVEWQHPMAVKCKEAIQFRWNAEEMAREVGMPDYWCKSGDKTILRYDFDHPISGAPLCAMIYFSKRAETMAISDRSVAQRNLRWVSSTQPAR